MRHAEDKLGYTEGWSVPVLSFSAAVDFVFEADILTGTINDYRRELLLET
jgi:hypothetical protein